MASAAEDDEPIGRRRASDAPVRRLIEAWLPAILVLGGGLIAWGTFQQSLNDTTRRVAVLEQRSDSSQDGNARILERLGGIEATLNLLKDRIIDPRPR